MRERAAELGGTCTVEPRPDGADQRERENDPPIWPQRPQTRMAAYRTVPARQRAPERLSNLDRAVERRGGITRALGPSWEDLSSGTTAPRTRRRCRGGQETRSRALGALRSRPLAARPPVSSSSRSPPAMSVARPATTVHASAPEVTVRRDCFRRTDSPEVPRSRLAAGRLCARATGSWSRRGCGR